MIESALPSRALKGPKKKCFWYGIASEFEFSEVAGIFFDLMTNECQAFGEFA